MVETYKTEGHLHREYIKLSPNGAKRKQKCISPTIEPGGTPWKKVKEKSEKLFEQQEKAK